jgi:hypothetical protein
VEDPNTLLVATKADDVEKAKDFGKSPGLKEAMKKDGVIGSPTIMFINAVYQDTAAISSGKRSMTRFTVKDWDAWKASFDSSRQERMDNGVMDRVYGYDLDDNHKVTVVVAIIDSTKAIAYWNSDQMKQRRAEAGVTGPHEKFDFTMAKKY